MKEALKTKVSEMEDAERYCEYQKKIVIKDYNKYLREYEKDLKYFNKLVAKIEGK